MTAPSHARLAAAAGVQWLARAQTRGGWWLGWRGFIGGSDASDEYTTAVIATTIAPVPDAAALAAAGWEALRARGRFRRALGRAGWGWNESVPDDADSTAWALRAAAAASDGSACDQASLALLEACTSTGGVVCYPHEAELREFLRDRFPPGYDMSAWTAPIPTVTATACLALPQRAEPLLAALRRMQHADGAWRDLWWLTPTFPTMVAVEALAATGTPEDARRIDAAAQWFLREQDVAGFDLACAVLAWCSAAALDPGWAVHARRGARALIESQRPDGGWPPSATILRGDPGDHQPWEHPDGTAPGSLYRSDVALDGEGAVTTAFAVRALHEADRLDPAVSS